MALSADVVRQFADALNTNFTEAQAKLILALVDAAADQAAASVAALGLPTSAPTVDDTYVLEIDSGAASWVPES